VSAHPWLDFMQILGMVISYASFLLGGLMVLRMAATALNRVFPLFYCYIVYNTCSTLCLYVVYWLARPTYPSAYWIAYLLGVLVEFTVLVEISDQIFRPYPAIRNLGRALTILISCGLGLIYVLPAIFRYAARSRLLFDFAMRASITKAIILVLLFYLARHYGSQLGRSTGGLMLGFSIYVAINAVDMATAKAFGSRLFEHILWVMEPLASALSVLVWTITLWEPERAPASRTVLPSEGMSSEAVALELTRFNNELTKFLHK